MKGGDAPPLPTEALAKVGGGAEGVFLPRRVFY